MIELSKTTVIRTLGLYQPFAGLMLHGKVETRWIRNGRKPPFPFGPYLIYATKKTYWIDQLCDHPEGMCTRTQVDAIKHLMTIDEDAFLEGRALMVCNLVSIIDPVRPDTQSTWVKYVPPDSCYRRVGLVFTDVKRIKPFAFKGKQGIGFLQDGDRSKIQFV